jgi:leucyl-tRNA synthetase
MVTHETYRAPDGEWVSPAEIQRGDGGVITRVADGAVLTAGRVEKMSKSKKNTVDPSAILGTYGADAVRLFMLSDTPPERDMEWTEAGVEGAWRYVNRLWRLVEDYKTVTPKDGAPGADKAEELRRTAHRAIDKTTSSIDAFAHNIAVAEVRILSNAIGDLIAALPADGEQRPADPVLAAALAESVDILVRLAGPMMPHLGEEMWQALGRDRLLAEESWPVADPALLVSNSVTMAVQVNGKLKATIDLPRDSDQATAEAAALGDAKIVAAMAGKPARKVIVVPNRIVNVVV